MKKELAQVTEKKTESFPDTIQAKVRGGGLNRVVTVGLESREKCRWQEIHLMSIFGGSEEGF